MAKEPHQVRKADADALKEMAAVCRYWSQMVAAAVSSSRRQLVRAFRGKKICNADKP
jgi:hypothetical protein